jgi:hypothetical protein
VNNISHKEREIIRDLQRNPRKQRLQLHRKSTGGCVRLAPSSAHHTPSSPSYSSSLNSGLTRLSTLMVGAQQVGEDARLSRID